MSEFRQSVVDKERNIEIKRATAFHDNFMDQYSLKYLEGQTKFHFCMVINEESKANAFQRFLLGKKITFTSYVVESTIKTGILSETWQWVPEWQNDPNILTLLNFRRNLNPNFVPPTPITDLRYKEIRLNIMEAARLFSNSYIDPSTHDVHSKICLVHDWTEVPCVQKFLPKNLSKNEYLASVFLAKLFKTWFT